MHGVQVEAKKFTTTGVPRRDESGTTLAVELGEGGLVGIDVLTVRDQRDGDDAAALVGVAVVATAEDHHHGHGGDQREHGRHDERAPSEAGDLRHLADGTVTGTSAHSG